MQNFGILQGKVLSFWQLMNTAGAQRPQSPFTPIRPKPWVTLSKDF